MKLKINGSADHQTLVCEVVGESCCLIKGDQQLIAEISVSSANIIMLSEKLKLSKVYAC